MIRNRQLGTIAGLLIAAMIGPAAAKAATPEAAESEVIDVIVVTSQRREQPLAEHAGNIVLVDDDAIAALGHQHIQELMTHVSGVWLSRGSGQEHLTAMRSPVLTGAGSCGAFLFLEDGIPIRPSGFCNVNQMFELNTEQAGSIEVIRGPGNALYGSNALHGIVNVTTPDINGSTDTMLALEGGSNEFLRLRALFTGTPELPLLGSVIYADDGGFRDDSGYRQGKLKLKRDWLLESGELTTVFAATELDQETAGFILGQDAYEDPSLNRQNLNPDAFRKASSQRLYGIWKHAGANIVLDVRPYLRHSDMQFLQHFLPGQPLEENQHVSAGALAALTFGPEDKRIIAGVDVEWSDLSLKETQIGPTAGSDFLRETRPEGKHYDFDVRGTAIAPYLQADFAIGDRLTLGAGVRFEYIHYDYDNGMLAGNTRDDGSICGFGGCLYSRPESRSDDFTNVAPKLSWRYRLHASTAFFGNLARGFRAPQATELYRLQNGQQIADLDSESLDSLEFGLRTTTNDWNSEVAVFAMRKRDSIYRDAAGFNVSGGRSRHEGLEIAIDWQLYDSLWLEIDASFARHIYDFSTVAARGETFTKGNDVDTAPRWFGSAELKFEPGNGASVAMQWTSTGDYYLDAENRFSYPGHELVNLRVGIDLSRRLSVTARLNNALNADYADRADFAFGQYRYFPGRSRELFIELKYLPDS